jgi:manganese-dependent inorganic pyrophosphatase
LEDLLNRVITEKSLDLFLFVVTDILNNDSIVVALGKEAERASAAFNVNLVNNTATLKGVVSRKMQIVPVLTEALK